MDIRTQSALLAAIVGIALGLSMLLRSGRPRVHTLYSLLALTVGGFYFSRFLWGVMHEPMQPLTWSLRVVVGANLILGAMVPATALGFFQEFLQVSPKSARNGRRFAYFTAILGVAVGASPLSEATWARTALVAWVLVSFSILIWLLFARSRGTSSRIERTRLRYLAIGAATAVLFSALDLLEYFRISSPSLGPIFCILYLFLLSQTLLRLRLMDLHELLGKIASQTVLAIILASVFTLLTLWVDNNAALFLFNTAVAAFVMLIMVEPLKAKVEEQVIALFFRERFELLRSLENLRLRTANIIDVREIAAILLDSLNETRRVTHASIFLLAEDKPGYKLLDFRGPPPLAFLDFGTARHVINASMTGSKALLLENIDRRISELRGQPSDGRKTREEVKRLQDIKTTMNLMKAGITLPLVGNDRVIGLFNLWDERVPEAFASDEIALILELSEHLATVIENSKLYEKMRERDRLAALGEMSAGLAHEIRNPLGAIKGAAQCLNPKSLPGEDGEFLEVILEEVDRLNRVVTAFLDYARPLKQNFGNTDLNEVVTRTVRLIQNEMPKNIELKIELSETLPQVNADAEQLKQVLINLVQNALQAIGKNVGFITLRTVAPERESELRAAASDMVEIQVEDNGPGIPLEQQQNIFVPFFTTKEKGTGLGLAICQRIVKNHGGAIAVQSRKGEGSLFQIQLPASDTESPNSLSPATVLKENQHHAHSRGTQLRASETAPSGKRRKKPTRMT